MVLPENMEDVEFIDAEGFTPQQQGALTYEQIVLEQIRRCIHEGSKEMIGGYVKLRDTSRGIKEEYVPDQRQVYIQSVNSLYDLLLSFFDEEMKKAKQTHDDMLAKSKQTAITTLKKQLELTDDVRIKQNIHYQIVTGYIDQNSMEAKRLIDEKIETFRFLFQQLLLMFQRKRYLMADVISDE